MANPPSFSRLNALALFRTAYPTVAISSSAEAGLSHATSLTTIQGPACRKTRCRELDAVLPAASLGLRQKRKLKHRSTPTRRRDFPFWYASFECCRTSFAILVYQTKHLSDVPELSTDISRISGPASAIFYLVEASSQENPIATDPFAAKPSVRPACSAGTQATSRAPSSTVCRSASRSSAAAARHSSGWRPSSRQRDDPWLTIKSSCATAHN